MKSLGKVFVNGLLIVAVVAIFASCQDRSKENDSSFALMALMNGHSVSESAPDSDERMNSRRAAGDNLRDVVINEVAWMGTTTTYYDEWIELYNNTNQDIDLNGWQLNSEDNNPAIVLTGVIPAQGYYLLERDDDNTVPGVTADQFFSGALDNGGDALTLKNSSGTMIDETGTTWAAGDNSNKYTMERVDPTASGLEASNWEDSTAGYAGGNGTPAAQNSVYDGSTTPPTDPPAGGSSEDVLLISEVQGSGTTSPYVNQSVTVEAIVTANFEASDKLKGFYIQEENSDSDGNANTSEGIFVFVNSSVTNVSVGDRVEVSGTVQEYYDSTQISSPTVTVTGTGFSMPTAATITLPVNSTSDLEKYEGMRVSFSQSLTVTENYNLGRYGEIWLSSGGRLMNPTNVAAPGSAALAVQASNDLNRILMDDGSTVQNPATVIHPAPALSMANTLRTGDTVSNLVGVLDYGYSYYRVHATATPTYTHTNPRTTQAGSVGGSLKVASFNVLNFFNGNGQGGGFPTSRGANTLEEFTRQRDKIIRAIAAMDADIVGLMEIENDGYGSSSAIQDLVNGINSISSDHYDFVDPGVSQIGTDEIAVGLLYKTSTVSPVGDVAILDSSVDSRFIDTKNRPALAQSFQENATGGVLTVAVNHLKSKGSDCNSLNDPDTGDGQGNCNLTRTAAAEALVDWLQNDPTASGDTDYLIIGDLNSYAKEDPITAIKDGGFIDLIDQHIGTNNAYSYIFNGQAGYLDHALASNTLSGQVTGVTEWHINTDEPHVLDYNVEYKTAGQISLYYSNEPYRSSDHDPVIVGFNLTGSSSGPGDMELTSGVAENDSLSGAGDSDIWTIEVPANASSIRVVVNSGSSDYDFFASHTTGNPSHSDNEFEGYTDGGEDVTFNNPAAGTWYIKVSAYSGSGAYTITATVTTGSTGGGDMELTSGVAESDSLSGAGDSDIWTIQVPANASSIRVVINSGSSDYDFFASHTTGDPTHSNNEFEGYTGGGEDATFNNPAAGTWYIKVSAYSGSGAYTITATVTTGSSGGSSWYSQYESVTSPNYPSNYSNNADVTQTLSYPGASKIKVHFSNFNVETDYDYVYILDGNNNQVAALSGNLGAFTSVEVNGDTLKVRFVSDYSVTKPGFKIDRMEYYL